MGKIIGSGWLLWCLSTVALAQPPRSSVFLFDLRKSNDTVFQFSAARFLTAFNLKGYNNHPYFFNSEELYLSVQAPQQSQPDFYALNLRTLLRTQITATSEGEYSPRPRGDFQHFTAVRTEYPPGDTLQRLWQFPLNRLTPPQVLLPEITNVGYYCWRNPAEVVLFLVDRPSQLVRVQLGNNRPELLASNVGRCLRCMPDGSVYFVQKNTGGAAMLMRYDPPANGAPGKMSQIIATPTGSEDFAVMNDGTLLMGQGSKVLRHHPQRGPRSWRPIGDFSGLGIRNITRLELSPENSRLVLVNQ